MPKIARFNLRKSGPLFGIGLVLLCALGVIYYLRNISNTYYFQSYKPPIACKEKTGSACFNGNVYAETVTGDDVTFTYTTADPPEVVNHSGLLSSFKKGEKVQVKTTGDDTGDDKVMRSIKAIN